MDDTKGQRLAKYLKSIGLSNVALGDKLGNITGAAVGNWTNDTQNIPDEKIPKILSLFPEINADWFINNRGPMLAMDTTGEPALPYNTLDKLKSEIESLKKEVSELKEDKRFLKDSLTEALRQRGGCSPGELEGGVEKPGKTG